MMHRWNLRAPSRRRQDNKLGRHLHSTRNYDPATGRFIAPDPSQQGGARSYLYASDQQWERAAVEHAGLCSPRLRLP